MRPNNTAESDARTDRARLAVDVWRRGEIMGKFEEVTGAPERDRSASQIPLSAPP